MKPIQIVARDRRLSAIHEAGHLVVARWRGVPGSAYIWPSGTDDPFETTWLGRAHFSMNKITPATGRLIGVAGSVAEVCWRCPGELDQPWFWEDHFEDPHAMSESDWHYAGVDPGEPDNKLIRTAKRAQAALLGPLWSELCLTARELIVDSRRRLQLAERAQPYPVAVGLGRGPQP